MLSRVGDWLHAHAPWMGGCAAALFLVGLTAVVLRGGEKERAQIRVVTGPAPTTTTDTVAPATAPPIVTTTAPEVFGPTAPPSSLTSTVALAVGPAVGVFATPGAQEPQRTLENPQPSGAPLVFLVLGQQPDWVNVLLPVRPNGSRGWVRRADLTLTQHSYAVVVELRAHRVTVFNAGQVIMQERAGIGTSNTPTPGGLYYLKELLKPPDPNSVYGTYAYGLSGFSDALSSFQGGEAVIGLHGTNDPSGLGKDVSAGCIRIRNEAISRLAGMLPLGTPVEIRL